MHEGALKALADDNFWNKSTRADHCTRLAALYRRQRRFDEAQGLLQTATINNELDTVQLAGIKLESAKLAQELEMPTVAMEALNSASNMLEECVGNDWPFTQIWVQLELGWVTLCQQDEFGKAEIWFQKAAGIAETFAQNSCVLERAIAYAGNALLLLLARKDTGQAFTYYCLAEECWEELHCREVDGAYMYLLYAGLYKAVLNSIKESNALVSEALAMHHAIFSAGTGEELTVKDTFHQKIDQLLSRVTSVQS